MYELLPGGSGIGGFVKGTRGAAAVEAKGRPATLVGGGVKGVGVGEILLDVHDAGVGVEKEDTRPGGAAVSGLVEAALVRGAEEVAEGCDVNDAGVAGVDENAADVAAVGQTHEGP